MIEDRNPIGILDENDLVAHQLPAAPELVTLGQLLTERRKNHFDLYRVPPAKSAARLIFGGDVMSISNGLRLCIANFIRARSE